MYSYVTDGTPMQKISQFCRDSRTQQHPVQDTHHDTPRVATKGTEWRVDEDFRTMLKRQQKDIPEKHIKQNNRNRNFDGNFDGNLDGNFGGKIANGRAPSNPIKTRISTIRSCAYNLPTGIPQEISRQRSSTLPVNTVKNHKLMRDHVPNLPKRMPTSNGKMCSVEHEQISDRKRFRGHQSSRYQSLTGKKVQDKSLRHHRRQHLGHAATLPNRSKRNAELKTKLQKLEKVLVQSDAVRHNAEQKDRCHLDGLDDIFNNCGTRKLDKLEQALDTMVGMLEDYGVRDIDALSQSILYAFKVKDMEQLKQQLERQNENHHKMEQLLRDFEVDDIEHLKCVLENLQRLAQHLENELESERKQKEEALCECREESQRESNLASLEQIKLQHQYDEAIVVIQQLKSENMTLRSDLQLKEHTVAKMKVDLQNAHKNEQQFQRDIRQSKDESMREMKELQHRNELLQHNFQGAVHDAESTLSESQNLLRGLREELDKKSREIGQLHADNDALHVEIRDVKQQKAKVNGDLHAHNLSLQRDIQHLKDTRQHEVAEMRRKDADFRQTQERLREVNVTANRLQQQYAERLRENGKLEEEIRDLQLQLQRSRNRLCNDKTVISEAVRSLTMDVGSLVAESTYHADGHAKSFKMLPESLRITLAQTEISGVAGKVDQFLNDRSKSIRASFEVPLHQLDSQYHSTQLIRPPIRPEEDTNGTYPRWTIPPEDELDDDLRKVRDSIHDAMRSVDDSTPSSIVYDQSEPQKENNDEKQVDPNDVERDNNTEP